MLYVRDPGIQEIFAREIWNPGNFASGIWYPWNTAQRIWNPANDWSLESSAQYPEPGVESRIQDCLGFPYMRQGKYGDFSPEILTTPENNITYHNALCLSPQNFA